MDKATEQILRTRMHGLYLTRKCWDITELSRELLGLHCWFHRNVAFSALIRGAELTNWKNVLTKTWLYRGTLHGVAFEELPKLLALHAEDPFYFDWLMLTPEQAEEICERIVRLMEDGVYSRAEMRRIFSFEFDEEVIGRIFSPWGGIFCYLARKGQAAFRSMTSRDFDLVAAEPFQTREEVLPELLGRFFTVYGPATVQDAMWFFGLQKESEKALTALVPEELSQLEYNKKTYYFAEPEIDMGDIPELTLLSGFDPLIVSYTDRSAVLPAEYKKAVIMSSGICLPTIAVNGQVAGIWNIKKKEPFVEFFSLQPKRIQDAVYDLVDEMRWKTAGQI